LLKLTREELMRHEAAGITTAAFPRTVRLGGIDCASTYLHEPGDPRDGLTVTVPIYALNQVSEERCDWLVPGMLKDKVLALMKSLHQRPRSRLVPLPDSAAAFCEEVSFAQGGLVDALLKWARDKTQLPLLRNDFKLDTLPAHLFMNLRVVDEHGRQLGVGRHLPALKTEWGAQARTSFQALASLKLASTVGTPAQDRPAGHGTAAPTSASSGGKTGPVAASAAARQGSVHAAAAASRGVRAELATPASQRAAGPAQDTGTASSTAYTSWTFGELPELMELRKGGQVLVGFPALVDRGTHVEIEVFDEPEVAATRHRGGLRRLVALQIREPLKYLEKNIPDLQKMAAFYMPLGTLEELRGQVIDVALDRAFLAEPWPTDTTAFARRLEEGRTRLTLIAQEVARLALSVLTEFAAANRKLKDSRPSKEVADDVTAQLQRLCSKRFLATTAWPALQHLPRYLKAVTLRLDKLRADPARDATRLGELRPLEQRFLRRLTELKGASDARLEEYRWLLEELRVSLFAQELRTPQPVSAKRLDKAWAQMSS
jgi:ATP-dependent helicase HrpA